MEGGSLRAPGPGLPFSDRTSPGEDEFRIGCFSAGGAGGDLEITVLCNGNGKPSFTFVLK